MSCARSRHAPISAVAAGLPDGLKSKMTTLGLGRGVSPSSRLLIWPLILATAAEGIGFGTITNKPAAVGARAGAAESTNQANTAPVETGADLRSEIDIGARSFGESGARLAHVPSLQIITVPRTGAKYP